MRNFFLLLAWRLRTSCFNFWESLRVILKYYPSLSFCGTDLSLLNLYLFQNPFRMAKKFAMSQGEKELYTYGETPLTTLEHLVDFAQVSSSDTFFELGCGRGRACFWVQAFIGCQVVGVEIVPIFVKKALQVVQKRHLERIAFRNEDILKTDLQGATVLYYYGTCAEPRFIKQLITRFKELPVGTRIVTVSFPLEDYAEEPLFFVAKTTTALFTWGRTTVYLNVRQ